MPAWRRPRPAPSAADSSSVSGWIKAALALIASQTSGAATVTSHLQGAVSSSETMRQDWLGRLVETSDSFGKHMVYGYNDADEQTRISDLALNKQADYRYDALGRRTHESLTKGGLVQREQTNSYNNQGWLTEVTAAAGYDAGGGAAINQQLHVQYAFDADGNRTRIRAEDGSQAVYSYDASGRMLSGRDDSVGDKPDQIVSALQYDGYGNRIAETRSGTTTTYTYDAANRVKTSSAGESFAYDANGNTTEQRVKNEDGQLLKTVTTYNAENRATVTVSTDKDGKATTSKSSYDAVGNVVDTRIDGDGYGFNEVTKRDVRYLEQSKTVANSYAKGAKGLSGASSFQYDVNGNLAHLDRGQNQQTKERSEAFFEYDLEGHIIGRADKAGALAGTTAGTTGGADFFQGYASDPDASAAPDSDWWQSVAPSVMQQLREQYAGSGAQLQSCLYANNKQLAQAQGTQSVSLTKLTLTGTTAQYGPPFVNGDGQTETPITGYVLILGEGDIARDGAGNVDRAATARRIAELHYAGFSSLSASAQAKVVAYVQSTLPASITAGTQLSLHSFIVLADGGMGDATQITDYSVKRIGLDGMPSGSIQSHVVRAGDTLQSIAQIYFGSASYWYLVAEANGLQGHEALQEGTTITIPNKVVNAANTSDTFNVYNESEIIGSTSPEIRTIKKKKKWYQKLVMILIVVILIVAAVFTAGAALGAVGALGATGAGFLGAAAAVGAAAAGAVGFGVAGAIVAAAAIGAMVYATASILTQGLAVASGLQEKFEWKQVTKAAGQGAIAGAATAASAGLVKTFGFEVASWQSAATRVGVEATRQYASDGKISSVAGLVSASVAGTNVALNGVQNVGLRLLENKVRGRGDNAMDWVNLASAAFFQASGTSGEVFSKGQMNWTAVAVHAIGAAIVTERRGGDAGRNYIGQAIGNSAQGVIDHAMSGPDQSAAETARLTRQNMQAGAAPAGAPSPSAAALTPAQQAALQAGYGPVPADKAEQLAQQGLLNQPRTRSEDQTSSVEPSSATPSPEDLRTAFRKSETESRNATSAVVQKGDTVIGMAKRLYGDDWRAGVAVIAASNDLKTDRYGNPIIREGQELNVLPLGGASGEQIDQLGRAGGALVAGNSRRNTEVRAADTLRAQAAEQQRIAELYASAGPRGGAGVAYGDAPRVATVSSAEGSADMFANLSPEFGGGSGLPAERSPLLSRAAGAVELVVGGALNSVVRIGGGFASIPFLIDSTDAAVAVQQGFEDKLNYTPKTEGAREIVQALQPVAKYVGEKIDVARSYSESKIGDGATTAVFAGGQFALEAGSTYFGGRAAMAALEGRAAVGAAQVTARSAVAELADGAGDVAAAATRSVDNVAAAAPKLGLQSLDPTTVGFSQSWVSFKKPGAKYDFDSMVNSMKNDGWVGKPIDAVLMPDGVVTTIDNTRVLAARKAGIDVQVNVRAFDELILDATRQDTLRVGTNLPSTWGEAALLRINKATQNDVLKNGGISNWSERFLNGSLYDPRVNP